MALGKLDTVKTGDTLTTAKVAPPSLVGIAPAAPVLAMALAAADRKDDVKLGQALIKLNEEDPSLTVVHNAQTHDTVLWGQGEMHLRVALERLHDRFGVNVESHPPVISYQETIRKPISQRGRHKKQSGGHGQFGDVVLEIKPLPRGAGFVFVDKIVGGAVPRNYIGAVEEGVVDDLRAVRSAFPVIDVQVTLTDGSYHSVDSSDQAFRAAARIGVAKRCRNASRCCWSRSMWSRSSAHPMRPRRSTPSCRHGAARLSASTLARAGPAGTVVRATMPEAEIGDLIVELRSATAGAGSFTRQFDRMAEVTGRAADQIIAAHRVAA